MQESIGVIADRSQGKSRLHRQRRSSWRASGSIKAAKEVREGGRAPGLEPEAQLVRSASFVLPVDAEFQGHALDAVKYRKGEPHIAVWGMM